MAETIKFTVGSFHFRKRLEFVVAFDCTKKNFKNSMQDSDGN